MNKVLTIAGFDPSAGAGILADIKTFEAFGVYGFAVCTAVTIQNEYTFDEPGWLSDQHIVDQLECLFREHRFNVVKIGLVKDLSSLKRIVETVTRSNPSVRIIWDPILKSSTGFTFHEDGQTFNHEELLSDLFLVTPNADEAMMLGIGTGASCNVLVKGGHKEGDQTEDELFLSNGQRLVFSSERLPGPGKHGTGCVLSAAITASLESGQSLAEACQTAKEYITSFISSNETLLGFHGKMHERI